MKNTTWNIGLLSLSMIIAYIFATNHQESITFGVWATPNTRVTLHLYSFVGIMGAGLLLGGILILYRYVALLTLAIKHKDIQIAFLLLGAMIQIVVIALLSEYALPTKRDEDNHIPIEAFLNGLKELRTCCLFKAYKNKPDAFITNLGIGRLVAQQDTWVNYWDKKKNDVNKRELLRLDTEKTWIREDTEFILDGNNEYVSVIKELAAISEGHFSPQNIVERWPSKDKVEVSFQLGTDIHTIYPKVNNDWADMSSILIYLNYLMKDVDYQFYMADGGDILIIGLTQQEKALLTEMVGVHFEKPVME